LIKFVNTEVNTRIYFCRDPTNGANDGGLPNKASTRTTKRRGLCMNDQYYHVPDLSYYRKMKTSYWQLIATTHREAATVLLQLSITGGTVSRRESFDIVGAMSYSSDVRDAEARIRTSRSVPQSSPDTLPGGIEGR
jgi:hypothetical protein